MIADNLQSMVILVIDDTASNVELMSLFLRDAGFQVLETLNSLTGLQLAADSQPALILLDVRMPQIDGFELCRRLKATPLTRDIPVIFTTSAADPVNIVKGLECGAVDYIVKPIQPEEVLARIQVHLQLRQTTQALEEKNQLLEAEIRDRLTAEAALRQLTDELDARVRTRTLEWQEATRKAELASQSKTRFLACMSHELRTPLIGILGYGELLIRKAQAAHDEGAVNDLSIIVNAGQDLLDLINNILDYSRIEFGTIEVHAEAFDLRQAIEQVILMIQPMAFEHQVHLQLSIADDISWVTADMKKVRQILTNLLTNACKFSPQGLVHLEVHQVTRRGQLLIQFDVRDTGIGMSSEQLERIFQPFTQGDPSSTRRFGGTGLGLSITKHYVEIMGGSISVTTAPDQGSTFTVALPIASAPAKDPTLDPVLLAALSTMPLEWRQELYQATLQLDTDSLTALVTAIEQAPLADTLSDLIETYQFEQLIQYCEQSLAINSSDP